MQTLEIIGYKRANFGKQASKQLRKTAHVPGVLYGGPEQVLFSTPMALLQELVYTPHPHFIHLHIEQATYWCILQDIQFHPVSEMILHVDFFQISEEKKIKMEIPTVFVGKSIGIGKGGLLAIKQRKLAIVAYPKDMPDQITIDISPLDLGQLVRVQDIPSGNYTCLASPTMPVASIEIPRALRSIASQEEAKKSKK